MEAIPRIEVDITIYEETFTRNINEDLLVSSDSLDECLEKQASLYAYYSIRMQQATAIRDQAEFEYDKIINEAMQIVRVELIDEKIRVTDKQVEARVKNLPGVMRLKQEYLDACSKRDQLYALVRALEHKKDAVLALAYRRRSEIDALTNQVFYSKNIPKSGIEE